MIKYICAPRSVLEPTVSPKNESAVLKESRNIHLRLLPASLLQPIAVQSLARVHLCASNCLGIDLFSENEFAVSIESRNIRMLAASCVLITTRLRSEFVTAFECLGEELSGHVALSYSGIEIGLQTERSLLSAGSFSLAFLFFSVFLWSLL
jgi:hypothetical protein